MVRKTLLALAVAAVLVACGKSSKEPEKAGASASATASAGKSDKDAKKEPEITLQMSPEDTITVASNALASGPVITGSIQPERRADLRAEVGAIVLQVLKENGEPVK